MPDEIFKYDDESNTDKLARKSRDSPFMILGIAGCIAAVGAGALGYKRRGGMSTSIYLMQFRVIAQGTVVAALMAGISYQMYTDYIRPKFKSE